jgi:hypothetical protein
MQEDLDSRTPRRLVRDSNGGLIAALHGSAAFNPNFEIEPNALLSSHWPEGSAFHFPGRIPHDTSVRDRHARPEISYRSVGSGSAAAAICAMSSS